MARGLTFERAVIREFTGTAGATFVALFAILLTTQLIRLLSQAAGGKLVSEAVVALLGFGAMTHLPILLSLTVFIAVLLTLSRSYRDSEMAVWFSSGLPLTAWVRPVLKFSLPLVVAIAALSLILSPWAQSKSVEYRQRMDTRDDVARVSPGAFKESASGERVFLRRGVFRGFHGRGPGWLGQEHLHQLDAARPAGRDGLDQRLYRKPAQRRPFSWCW
jgi:lipopolysaccharide export system permease protein